MPIYSILDQDPEGDFMTVLPNLSFIYGRGYVLPNHIVKQPVERRLLLFECASALDAGDSISTFVATTYSEAGAVVLGLLGVPVVNGTAVSMWLEGGTNGLVYPTEMIITTVLGEVIENDIRIVVREKGY